MAKITFEDAKEKRQRQEGIRRFAESIPVKDVPQREIPSPYPRVRPERAQREPSGQKRKTA